MLKALSLLVLSAGLLTVPAARANELTRFRLQQCDSVGKLCLQVDSAKVAESTLGQIWVSGDANVTLSGAGRNLKWKSARVVIDLKREQVVIEEFKNSIVIETVISLSAFTVKRNEIVL